MRKLCFATLTLAALVTAAVPAQAQQGGGGRPVLVMPATRQPVMADAGLSFPAGTVTQFEQVTAVPEGRRLMIEYASLEGDPIGGSDVGDAAEGFVVVRDPATPAGSRTTWARRCRSWGTM